ncbi:hypothetical protein CYQ88_06170 [Hydrogenovibrio sp. SC-1]|nr:hypothetical protein CYQ88_06170 [Hydrogenovibrio sp. SC-1]
MADERFTRWQGQAIAQLSVAIALITGLSISSIAVGFSLLQDTTFTPLGLFKDMFVWSFPLLLLAAIASVLSVVSRLLDFRLTARMVRKNSNSDYTKPLTIFWISSEGYGRITWFLFWLACIAFLFGVILLFTSIGTTYANNFWPQPNP